MRVLPFQYPERWCFPAVCQAVLYHGDACDALGEDAAFELCDWACRQLLHLNTAGRSHADAPGTCFGPSAVTEGS